MAHIQRRTRSGTTTYRVRYTGPDGHERNRSFDRRVDAETFLHEVSVSIRRGTWIDPALGETTLTDWSTRWLDAKRSIKPKTRAGYRSLLRSRILPTFGDYQLARIDRVHVERWVSAMDDEGLSATRIRKAHRLLKAMLTSAIHNGLLIRNVADGIDLPRQAKPDHRFLSSEEVARLAEAGDDQHRVLIYVLAYGGLRWSEAVALRRGRCDLLRRRLTIAEAAPDVEGELVFDTTKSDQVRTVQVPPFVADMLGAHLTDVDDDPDALVFSAPMGGPLRYSNYRRKVWNPARERANLPDVTPHDLRHTCASLMRAMGADAKAVQSQLGHSSIQVTMDTYTHLFEHDLDDVMARLDAAHATAREAAVSGHRRPVDGPSVADVRRLPER